MVVIVIIGILATLAIPKFNEASLKAKISEAPTVLSSYDNAQLAYLAEANAMGKITSLVMKDVGSTKYYTYTQTWTAYDQQADYEAGANPTGMGSVGGKSVWTVIDISQNVTHTKNAEFDQYLPNWK
jgi:Tfp pilus assembly protein PilE